MMNLFDSLDDEVVRSYVKEVAEAQEHDTLVQSPEELGRWLALLCSGKQILMYAEVGVGAGGTFRLTREVLRRKRTNFVTACMAIDNGSDAGVQDFLEWFTEESPDGVRIIPLNVDDPSHLSFVRLGNSPSIDACLLDAARTYESTWRAFLLIGPLMADGGLIAFHDTDEPRCPGVGRAVRQIAGIGEWKVVAHYSDQFGLTVLGRS